MLALCPVTFGAFAAAPLPRKAVAAFEQYAPGRHLQDYATAYGDINGDGITNFVTFVGDPAHVERGVENLQIAVFLGNKDGRFSFYEISQEILGHELVSHNLRIARQSIFLQREASGGGRSRWAEEFQFKMQKRHLMLIGLETSKFQIGEISEGDTVVSANLVSGEVIRWTDIGKKRTRAQKIVSTLMPLPLKDFDFNLFSDAWGEVLW